MDDKKVAPANPPSELLRWRSAKGFTQREAANEFGMDPGAYCRTEGGGSVPRIETIRRIALVTKSRGLSADAWAEFSEARRRRAERNRRRARRDATAGASK